MRINIYKQIRGFYSLVFESKFEFRPTHISLYMFLLNQNNRSNWIEWFKCPFDTVMLGACISSNKTYYSVLKDLQSFGLIKYKRGINNYKAPQINIIPLQQNDNNIDIPTPECDSSVKFTQLTTLLSTGLSEQQCEQLDTQLSEQLSKHKDILITGNFKLIIDKVDSNNSFPNFKEIEDYGKENGYILPVQKIINHYTNGGEFKHWVNSKGKKVKLWKRTLSNNWFKDEYKIIENKLESTWT